jgi:hypothetical protein
MARKLVRDMTPEEHEQYKKDLQAKKDKIRSMNPEERAEYEKKRQRKWSDSYIQRAYDTINFRTPKGGRLLVKTFALENGYTMNDFLRKMVCEGMLKAGYEFDVNLIFPSAVMPEELVEDKE